MQNNNKKRNIIIGVTVPVGVLLIVLILLLIFKPFKEDEQTPTPPPAPYEQQSIDTDSDGILDSDEVALYNTDPSKYDSDGDTLGDGLEVSLGLAPTNPNTDGDQLNDNEENNYGRSPMKPDDELGLTTVTDYLADTDGDGLTNGDELTVYNTLVNDRDTDNDGMSDYAEAVTNVDVNSKFLNKAELVSQGETIYDQGIFPYDMFTLKHWLNQTYDTKSGLYVPLEDEAPDYAGPWTYAVLGATTDTLRSYTSDSFTSQTIELVPNAAEAYKGMQYLKFNREYPFGTVTFPEDQPEELKYISTNNSEYFTPGKPAAMDVTGAILTPSNMYMGEIQVSFSFDPAQNGPESFLDVQYDVVSNSVPFMPVHRSYPIESVDGAFLTNPLVSDTDGDGIKDGDEVYLFNTNPLNIDTDGDHISDDIEVVLNSGIYGMLNNIVPQADTSIANSELVVQNWNNIDLNTYQTLVNGSDSNPSNNVVDELPWLLSSEFEIVKEHDSNKDGISNELQASYDDADHFGKYVPTVKEKDVTTFHQQYIELNVSQFGNNDALLGYTEYGNPNWVSVPPSSKDVSSVDYFRTHLSNNYK